MYKTIYTYKVSFGNKGELWKQNWHYFEYCLVISKSGLYLCVYKCWFCSLSENSFVTEFLCVHLIPFAFFSWFPFTVCLKMNLKTPTVVSLASSLCVPIEYFCKISVSRSFLWEEFVILLLGFRTELDLCINLFTWNYLCGGGLLNFFPQPFKEKK